MYHMQVCRLTKSAPTRVCHIPQALDYFLTEEMVERDSVELPHLLTWARSVSTGTFGTVQSKWWREGLSGASTPTHLGKVSEYIWYSTV
jgi:hypothetical protein